MKERVTVSLPVEQAKKLRRMAAEMHATVSGVVALAVERLWLEVQFQAIAERTELFARAALMGVAELVKPDDPATAARRLVTEARSQVKRMQERERTGKPSEGEGAGTKAGTKNPPDT